MHSLKMEDKLARYIVYSVIKLHNCMFNAWFEDYGYSSESVSLSDSLIVTCIYCEKLCLKNV